MIAHLANVFVLLVADVTEEFLVHLLRVRPQAQTLNLELFFQNKKASAAWAGRDRWVWVPTAAR